MESFVDELCLDFTRGWFVVDFLVISHQYVPCSLRRDFIKRSQGIFQTEQDWCKKVDYH